MGKLLNRATNYIINSVHCKIIAHDVVLCSDAIHCEYATALFWMNKTISNSFTSYLVMFQLPFTTVGKSWHILFPVTALE